MRKTGGRVCRAYTARDEERSADMKRTLTAWLIMLAIAAGACCEEAAFREEDFAGAAVGEEAFFEEDAFFDGDFFAEMPGEESAAPENAGEAAAGDGIEERALIWQETDTEVFSNTGTNSEQWGRAPQLFIETFPRKPGKMKLTWRHTDYDGKTIRLPKDVSYYVYEWNTTGRAWILIGKTRKRALTLNNVTAQLHTFKVRPELHSAKKLTYGKASEAVTKSTVSEAYKTISSLTMHFGNDGTDFVAVMRVREATAIYRDYHLKLTCKVKSGKKTKTETLLECDLGALESLGYGAVEWTDVVVDGKILHQATITIDTNLVMNAQQRAGSNFTLKVTPFMIPRSGQHEIHISI